MTIILLLKDTESGLQLAFFLKNMKQEYTALENIFNSRNFFVFAIIIVLTLSAWFVAYDVSFLLDFQRGHVLLQKATYLQLSTNWMDDLLQINPNSFFSAPEKPAAALLPLSQRYRLAGTFIAFEESQQDGLELEGENFKRRLAILDDIQKNEQLLVQEGSSIPNTAISVIYVGTDKVTLQEGSKEEELLLNFASAAGGNANALRTTVSLQDGQTANAPIAKGRFGIQVETNRWVLSRDRLLDYYQELLNNTERLAKIYDSLKPVYREDRKISGYILEIEGEEETFKELGLKQGDIVRKVNSMAMTSQARAEYFLREFVKNRINGFVVEIERQGKVQNLIYLVR